MSGLRLPRFFRTLPPLAAANYTCLALALVTVGPVILAGQAPGGAGSSLTCEEVETFLKSAKIGSQATTAKGVTQPTHALLDDGTRRHEGFMQTVHESKARFEGSRGDTELNFKDWWEFNVAAYELSKLLEMNMIPPYVERKLPGGKRGSISWGVEGMLEIDRKKKNLEPPNPEEFNKQLYVLRVFNQLIRDTDINLTNFLITPDWQVWRIDFSRAFRLHRDLANVKDLVQCDRKLLANLRKLDKPLLIQKLRPYLTSGEIDAVLERRNKIVRFFDDQIKAKGESAVLFELPRIGQPCGAGLKP